jgi:hypothetical protein
MATRHSLGRPLFWIALVLALYALALTTGWRVHYFLAVLGTGIAALVQAADEKRWAFERRVRKAIALSGYTVNSVAVVLLGHEKRAPEVQRMLRGERPFDMAKWEAALGNEFAQHYATLTLLEFGAPDYIGRGIKVMPEGAL